MSSFRAGADEAHREQTSERVHESHARSAKAGHVAGGRVFGYRNEHVGGTDAHGNFLKSQTERVINPAEAAVVRRIFELYDQGAGLKRISKQLAAEGALAPKPFVRKDPTQVQPCIAWSPSTVRAISGESYTVALSCGTKRGSAPSPGARSTSSRAQRRSGCAHRPSTCASSTSSCGRGCSRAVRRQRSRSALRQRTAFRPPVEGPKDRPHSLWLEARSRRHPSRT